MNQPKDNPAAIDPNCAEPVCGSKIDMFKGAMKNFAMNKKATKVECPCDREELGRHTWTLMHTMAAYYPENPTMQYKAQAQNFIQALSLLYPCKICADDFQEDIKKNPIRLNSREDLSLWMCEQHNDVNKKLGKRLFKCTLQSLDERWKVGHPSCWVVDQEDFAYSLGQTTTE